MILAFVLKTNGYDSRFTDSEDQQGCSIVFLRLKLISELKDSAWKF